MSRFFQWPATVKKFLSLFEQRNSDAIASSLAATHLLHSYVNDSIKSSGSVSKPAKTGPDIIIIIIVLTSVLYKICKC